MAMKYEDALRVWGFRQLEEVRRVESYWGRGTVIPLVEADLIRVEMNFDEGFACCGGTDEGCYCSYAQSPSAEVVISDGYYRREIPIQDFDFVKILGEIVAAGGGEVTA